MEGMYRVLKSVELKPLGILLNKAESENVGTDLGGKASDPYDLKAWGFCDIVSEGM